MNLRTTGGLAAVLMVLAMLAAPGAAQASSPCSIGDSGITTNQLGEPAVFKRLVPLRGMNCPSARYVMNKWLRRAYQRSYDHSLPTHFWDGYVTWHCSRTTWKNWRCDEDDSGTAFRFVAYRL